MDLTDLHRQCNEIVARALETGKRCREQADVKIADSKKHVSDSARKIRQGRDRIVDSQRRTSRQALTLTNDQ